MKTIILMACIFFSSSVFADARSDVCVDMASIGGRMYELALSSDNKARYDSGVALFMEVLAEKLNAESREGWLIVIEGMAENSWILKDIFTNAEVQSLYYRSCLKKLP